MILRRIRLFVGIWMAAFVYICPLCQTRLEVEGQAALPPTCPSCGLDITTLEMTQQQFRSTRVGRRAIVMNVLTWLIGLVVLNLLLGGFVRFLRL